MRRRAGHILALAIVVSALPRYAAHAAIAAPEPAPRATTACTTFLESPLFAIPRDMAYGPRGRIWITEIAGTQGAIEGIDPGGSPAVRATLPDPDPFLGSGIAAPDGITVGADGALWFVGWGARYDRLGRLDPTTLAYSFIDLPAGSHATKLVAIGPDLWIAATGSDRILKLTPPATIAAYALPVGSRPSGLAPASGGGLWVAERGRGRIARMAIDGTYIEYAVGDDPTLVADAGTFVWYTKHDASKIGRLDPVLGAVVELATPTPASGPEGLARDASGALWFTESATDRLGRVDSATFPAAGSINETVLSVSTPSPGMTAALPDGTIWFLEHAPYIAHFKPAPDGAVLPLPPAVALSVSGPSALAGATRVYASTTTFTLAASAPGVCVDTIFYRFYPAGGAPGMWTSVSGSSASFTMPNGAAWVIEFYAVGPGGASLTRVSDPFTIDDSAFPDRVPPTLMLPAPITTTATGLGGATVMYVATAIDDVDPAPAVSCDHGSGAVYPPGVTTVTCVARDASGNESAPGSFTITVTVPPPVLVVPGSVTAGATGVTTAVSIPVTASSVVDGKVFLVTCAGDGVPTASAYTPGAVVVVAPTGTRAVRCTTSDSHGNTVSADTVLYVTTPPPAVNVPGPFSIAATSASGAVVTYPASATSIGYGALTPSCVPSSGATFAIGTTTVTCSVTDPDGQHASASFAVTVFVPAPTLSLPADIALSSYRSSVTVTYAAMASSAVYGPLAVTCAPPRGSVFLTGTTTVVSCAASDGHGQSVTGSFRVSIARVPCPDVLVALAPTGKGTLTIDGGAQVTVECGAVIVASTSRDALVRSGNGTLTAPEVRVGLPYSDAYAGLGAPDVSGLPTFGGVSASGGTWTLQPGTYTGPIRITNGATVTFMPGPYVLQSGLSISGGSASGSGVVFYNAPAPARKLACGDLDVRSGVLHLRAPAAGTHAGVLFMQDPRCANSVRFASGGGPWSLDGTLYAPAAAVDFSGSGSIRVGLLISARTIHVSGSAVFLFDQTQLAP